MVFIRAVKAWHPVARKHGAARTRTRGTLKDGTLKQTRGILIGHAALLAVGILFLGGCFGPNYQRVANDLRAKNNQLADQLGKAQAENKYLHSTVTLLTQQLDSQTPHVATLPRETMDTLITVGKVELRGSTDVWDVKTPGVMDSFRVHVRPMSDDGVILPATGTLTVEAFDLAVKDGPQRLGTWSFTAAQLKKLWYENLGLRQFAVICPWTTTPAHNEITFKIRFVDALTNRVFEDQKAIKLHLPEAAATMAGK